MSEDLKIKTMFDVSVSSKEEVIERIVEQGIAENIILPAGKENVYASFISREEMGTTGLVDGFAIPHAKHTDITQASLLIYKLKNAVEWESIDGEPINFVFGILVPSEQEGTVHLKILSEIAKMLMKKEAKDRLILAESEAEIIAVIDQYITMK